MDIITGFAGAVSGGARALARNLFSGFYERGISANAALNELRSMGLGYRRQDFLNDFRQGEKSYDQETAIRYVRSNAVPSESILEPKYFGTPDKYSMTFKYRGTDLFSGEDVEGYFMYHRNSLDTRTNMENDAEEYLDSEAEKYPFLIEQVTVVEGYINPLWK